MKNLPYFGNDTAEEVSENALASSSPSSSCEGVHTGAGGGGVKSLDLLLRFEELLKLEPLELELLEVELLELEVLLWRLGFLLFFFDFFRSLLLLLVFFFFFFFFFFFSGSVANNGTTHLGSTY
jgi:hypothetical protein